MSGLFETDEERAAAEIDWLRADVNLLKGQVASLSKHLAERDAVVDALVHGIETEQAASKDLKSDNDAQAARISELEAQLASCEEWDADLPAVRLLNRLDDDIKEVNCPKCNGDGEMQVPGCFGYSSKTCDRCGGSGKIWVNARTGWPVKALKDIGVDMDALHDPSNDDKTEKAAPAKKMPELEDIFGPPDPNGWDYSQPGPSVYPPGHPLNPRTIQTGETRRPCGMCRRGVPCTMHEDDQPGDLYCEKLDITRKTGDREPPGETCWENRSAPDIVETAGFFSAVEQVAAFERKITELERTIKKQEKTIADRNESIRWYAAEQEKDGYYHGKDPYG